MSKSLKNRLLKLESSLGVIKNHRVARVVCDPDIFYSEDFSDIEAEVLLVLPDNGHRLIGDQIVPKGSYLVFYS